MGYDAVECGAFLLYGNGTGEEGCAGEAGEHGDVGTGSVYGGGDSGDRVHGGGGCYEGGGCDVEYEHEWSCFQYADCSGISGERQ